jgi:AP-4 complex subunit epsilon-1
MRRALCDKEPSVMGAALNLYLEAVKDNPGAYKDTASSFVIILKQIIEHKLPREFDYHRMPAPWIQIKIL